MELPIGVLSGGERRRVELARILFAGSDVLCLDEPTNHLDVDAKTWLMGFLRQYRGALLVISHDLDLLDEAITRVLHLDRPTESADRHDRRVPRHLQPVPRRPRRGREAPGSPGGAAGQGDRPPAARRRPLRRQGDEGGDGAQHREAHRPARGRPRRTPPRRTKAITVRFPDPPPCGQTVVVAEQLCKGYGGPPVFEDVGFDLGRGERLLVLGLNGAGKTSLLRILAGETEADLGHFEYGYKVAPGYYAQEHDNLDPAGVGARQPPRRRAGRPQPHRDRAARPARHDGLVGREGVPGRRHAVGRREDQAGAGDADGRSQQPAAARRADQQPRSAVAPGGRRRRSRRGRARSCSSATTPSSSPSWRPPRCC